MSRPVATASRPQAAALQSYLDALLQDSALELELADSVAEAFSAAVREEQARDARTKAAVAVLEPTQVVAEEKSNAMARVEPLVELGSAGSLAPSGAALSFAAQPQWADEPFECLLFDVAGLTLAVPLVSLGSIYPLEDEELTPLFGQPDWFLGLLPCQGGNLKVLDTARWVMPDRYRDDFRQGLRYVISVQGYEWGLAVHQVSRSIRLDPSEVKWRTRRSQRPWLAGTVIEQMCALLDVAALAEQIASGAIKDMTGGPTSPRK